MRAWVRVRVYGREIVVETRERVRVSSTVKGKNVGEGKG